MPKLPYMKFYVNDWHTDCQLAMCSLAARACWLELLCGMHSLDQSGVITGTADQIARICRCSCVEFVQAVNELKTNHVGDITVRNGVYTIVNRRMKREHKAGGLARMRQSRYHEKANARNEHENYMGNAEKSDQKQPHNSLNNNENNENKRKINGEKTPDIQIQIQNNSLTTFESDNAPAPELTESENQLFSNWLEVRREIHGDGKPMPVLARQAQLERLLRLPAEIRVDALRAAIAGTWKNIQDIRESAPGSGKREDKTDAKRYVPRH